MSQNVNFNRINEDAAIFGIPPFSIAHEYYSYQRGINWGTHLEGIPEYWKNTKGKGVKVAILDTGIAPNHPALKENVLEVVDFTRTASNGGDGNGHGTHIAGIVAASEHSVGQGGIAPEAKLVIGKVLDDTGKGSPRAITNGIEWATNCGVDLVVINFCGHIEFPPMKSALIDAHNRGIIVISTAGGCGPNFEITGFPANLCQLLTVGTTKRNIPDHQTPAVIKHKTPDLLTNFQKVPSTYPPIGYMSLSGPSVGTAIVAGIAALAISKHKQFGGNSPIKNKEDLKLHLKHRAIPFISKADITQCGWNGMIHTPFAAPAAQEGM